MFNRKKDILNAWIPVILFVAIFITMLVIATFKDLEISKFLTRNALPKGQVNYLAKDIYGVAGEMVGAIPVFLLFSFAGVVTFHYFDRLKLKRLRIFMRIIGVLVVFIGMFLMFRDIFKYLFRHLYVYKYLDSITLEWKDTDLYKEKKLAMYLVYGFLALIFSTVLLFAGHSLPKDKLKNLLIFAVVAGLAAIIIVALTEIIKTPMGRVRYRSMHAMGDTDFRQYTPWYVMNGERRVNLAEASYGLEKDAFKSFPSGHTSAAGITYCLFMLPEVLKIKNKELKRMCYEIPIFYTGAVALSRIVAGAHYMSDVLFGGTMAFLFMILFKEMFIVKFKNIKRLFGKYTPVIEETIEIPEQIV